MHNCFVAYGLGFCSELIFPGLPLVINTKEVIIRFGVVDPESVDAVVKGEGYRASPKNACLFFKGVGKFLIKDGREIIIDPEEDVEDWTLRLYLLGSVMAVLLHQRGRLVLHGSSVSIGGEAVAILGSSGSGKSTIAAALHSRGHEVLSDDIISIEFNGRDTSVYGFPLLKLSPTVASSLGYSLQTLSLIDPDDNKYGYYAKPKFSKDRIPLRHVYSLFDGTTNEIKQLNPQEAFFELFQNTRTAFLLEAQGASSHLNQCAKLASTISIQRLERFKDLNRLTNIAQMIEEDLANKHNI